MESLPFRVSRVLINANIWTDHTCKDDLQTRTVATARGNGSGIFWNQPLRLHGQDPIHLIDYHYLNIVITPQSYSPRSVHHSWCAIFLAPTDTVDATQSCFKLSITSVIPSVSGTSFSFLHQAVSSASTPIQLSSCALIHESTTSWPGILVGGESGSVWHSARSYVTLYFHIVGRDPESRRGQRGQWIGTLEQGADLDDFIVFP